MDICVYCVIHHYKKNEYCYFIFNWISRQKVLLLLFMRSSVDENWSTWILQNRDFSLSWQFRSIILQTNQIGEIKKNASTFINYWRVWLPFFIYNRNFIAETLGYDIPRDFSHDQLFIKISRKWKQKRRICYYLIRFKTFELRSCPNFCNNKWTTWQCRLIFFGETLSYAKKKKDSYDLRVIFKIHNDQPECLQTWSPWMIAAKLAK